MARTLWLAVGVLVGLSSVCPAQRADPTAHSRFLLRAGAGAMSANGVDHIRVALGGGAGILWAGRHAVLIHYVRQTAYRVPGRSDFGILSRQFVLAQYEWLPAPLDLEYLGEWGLGLRVSLGGVWREQLEMGGVIGAGVLMRYALNSRLSATAGADVFLTWLPRDPVPRCDYDVFSPLDCSPFASARPVRSEGQLSIGVELRP